MPLARNKKPDAADETAAGPETSGLVTVRPKPEKRLNAKERAKAKYKNAKDNTKEDAKDGTKPTMTAKAKSKVKSKKAKAAA